VSDGESDAQARIYQERAEEYDELIRAEDADGRLSEELSRLVPIDDAVLIDVGAGTGRIARLLGRRARHVHLVERASPMLELAKQRLAEADLWNASFHLADARALPLPTACADVAIAAWVFGHFRSWMPATWRDDVGAALGEMRRVLKPGGASIVIETLGTGHETPRSHPALDEYFAFLESEHGFSRTWIRTDYVFDDVETAARVAGSFFGDAMRTRIQAERSPRLPECTAIFLACRSAAVAARPQLAGSGRDS